jgi:tRNA threonylcarbamoyladenosine dehydratase
MACDENNLELVVTCIAHFFRMNFLASRVDLKSHRSQLFIVALSASAVTAGLFTAYNNYNKRQKRIELQKDVLRSVAKSSEPTETLKAASLPLPPPDEIWLTGRDYVSTDLGYDEKLIREQLGRNYAFFGEEGMAKIRGANVVVVGCGGVGSWAAVMLVRS